MTIVVNGRFLTQPVTGVQRYARCMLEEIARRPRPGVRVVVAAPRGKLLPPLPSLEILQDAFPLTGHLWEQARLPWFFRRAKGDVLWSPCNTGPLAVRRQVVTIHDAAVFAGPEWFSPAFRTSYRALHRALGRLCPRIVTVSRFSGEELARHGVCPAEKISVIPNGVDVPAAAPRAKRNYVFFIGSRDPRKNLATLLRAWSLLPSDIRAGRELLVAGGGAVSFAAEKTGEVPAGVRFLGRVESEELLSLYAGAEVLVSPSVYEGFGLPPLEAMAAGTPVVVSDIPPHREVCGEAADYFPATDAPALADALTAFFYNPDRRAEMAEAGRRRAALFTWGAAVDALLKVFKELP